VNLIPLKIWAFRENRQENLRFSVRRIKVGHLKVNKKDDVISVLNCGIFA